MNFQFPKIDISVTKEWEGPEAEEVTLVLLADGVETDETLVLNSENKWEGIFQGLDKYNTNKEEIIYKIVEVRLDNYNSSITGTVEDGFTVTNTYMPHISPKVEVTGTKVWVGGPKDKPTIEIQLYRNDETFGNPVNLASGELEYTWTELDKTDTDGKDYVYSIKEVEVPKNYQSKISEDGLTVINTYIEPPEVGVSESYIPKISKDKLTVTKTDIEPSIVPEQIQALPRTGSKNNLITLVFAIVLTSVGVSMVFRKKKAYDE